MYRLLIEPPALADLKSMTGKGGSEERWAYRIIAILQEIKASQALLRDLTTDHHSTDDYDIGKFLEFWNAGTDLWKLKVYEFQTGHGGDHWDLIPYRVLYAYDSNDYAFRILGVLPRSFNYDKDHELTKRILKTYSDLGLPKHKVFTGYGGNRKPH